MKKYEAPSIEFYVFEMPESIMDSNCPTLQCTADDLGCIVDTGCITDGVCITDGLCVADLSTL